MQEQEKVKPGDEATYIAPNPNPIPYTFMTYSQSSYSLDLEGQKLDLTIGRA